MLDAQAYGVEHSIACFGYVRAREEREKRPNDGPLRTIEKVGAYFGSGVVVLLKPFLLFFPPLSALLVLVAFLPVLALGVVESVLPRGLSECQCRSKQQAD